MRMHSIHIHSHLCQLRRYCCIWAGKYYIGLFHSFQFVALLLHSLDGSMYIFYCLMIILCGRMWYTINGLDHSGISSFFCGYYRFPLLAMGYLKENIEVWPGLLVGSLTYLLSAVLLGHFRLCQKGDPFGHHNGVSNRLPSCSCKLYPLFQFFNQSGKEFRRA